jgi:hypothetical protein
MMRTALRFIALASVFATAGNLAAQQRVNLPAKDTPLTLATRSLFEVGELEGEEYETFANVVDVAFDQAGNLYVLDGNAYRVVVFDASGRYTRTIGRQGDGPGEFGFPAALAVLPSGELVVNDAMKSNLQVFGPDGAFRRTVVLPEDLGRAMGRMRLSPKGGVITETMPLRRLAQGADRTAPQRLELPARSVTRLSIGESATGQKLFTAPARNLAMTAPRTGNGGATRLSMALNAFEPSLLWAATADGGIATLSTEPYRITITDPQGRAVRTIERPIQPRKVTAADKKKFMENMKNGTGTGGGGVAMMVVGTHLSSAAGTGAQVRPAAPSTMRFSGADVKEEDITWNELIPVVAALGTDSFGRLWVQRTGPDLGVGPIDLIDASGKYLGTLPKQEMPRAFGPGGRIAYITKDDMDVQRVVVKQLQR